MLTNIQDAVIQLHDIARFLAKELGEGTIVQNLRAIADQVNQMDKPVLVAEKNQVD